MKLLSLLLILAVAYAVSIQETHHQTLPDDSQIHEVIIVGAGFSGLRASQILTKKQVQHIILEATDHIGGRVAPMQFAGETVNKGASFVHNTTKGNPVADYLRAHYTQAMVDSTASYKTIFYQGFKTGAVPEYQSTSARKLFVQVVNKLKNKLKTSQKDVSVSEAIKEVLKEYQWEWPFKLQMVKWFFKNLEYIDGTKLEELSAFHVVYLETFKDLCPVKGLHTIIPTLFPNIKNIHFNRRVTHIDYTDEIIVVHTNSKVYRAKKVLSSLPLGVLKAGTVQFTPALPEAYASAIRELGWSIADKLYATFDKPFWKNNSKTLSGTTDRWLSFITSDPKHNKYSAAWIVPGVKSNMLSFYIAGDASREIGSWSTQKIKEDLSSYLDSFGSIGEPVVLDVKVSKWHQDPNTLGSFSYYKVGNKPSQFIRLGLPIQNKLWFIGEHTRPELNYYLQGAYKSGEQAANQAAYCLQNQCEEGEFDDLLEQQDE